MKRVGMSLLNFFGKVLLADLAIFVLVAGSCFLGTRCTNTMWTNRMFWAGIGMFMLGAPAIISSLNTGSGIEATAFGAGQALQAAVDTINNERRQLGGRWQFFFFTLCTGAIAIGMSIALDAMPLDNFMPKTLPPKFGQPERTFPAKDRKEIDNHVEQNIKFFPVVGLSMAVYDGRNPVFYNSYGETALDSGEATTPDTIYLVGQISQQFTAAAILQLSESGQLDLNEAVTQYIPDLPADFEAVKISHLLNHTSGIVGDEVAYQALFDTTTRYTPKDLLTQGNDIFAELAFTPGSQWEESFHNYRLLGMILEEVTGQAYGDYLQEHIFTPLKMHNSNYCTTVPDATANGHYVEEKEILPLAYPNLSVAYAAAGLCSTPNDLILWQHGLANGLVIQAKTYEAMTTKTVLSDGSEVNYGYGLHVNQDRGKPYIGTDSRFGGFDGSLRYYVYENMTFVFLTNTNISESRYKAGSGLDRLVRMVFNELTD